jgi:hypothetical protein
MHKLTILFFAILSFPVGLASQAIAGLQIGDPSSAIDKLYLKPIAQASQDSMETRKFKLADGDELSVTFDSRADKIVYLERDWNKEPKNTPTEFRDFTFGVTTLENIRKANQNNGFAYQKSAMGKAGGRLFTLNAYGLIGKPGLIVVFATSFDIEQVRKELGGRYPSGDELARSFKLEGLILAQEVYLDEIWGTEKAYDKDYKPISWGASPTVPK